jgi:predicted dehydrogenase
VKLVLVGAGRMGHRHLSRIAEEPAVETVHVVDPRAGVEVELPGKQVVLHRSLDDVPLAELDAAILAETAGGRLERFERVLAAGVGRVLVEKPLEQSRERVRRMAELAAEHGADVRVHHYRRSKPLYDELREAGGPFQIAVVGGAYGLACVGIHYFDAALYVTGGEPGRLLFGEVEQQPIESPRGEGLRDYGGHGLFEFPGGSRFWISSAAGAATPVVMSIAQPSRLSILELLHPGGVVYERDPASTQPPFRYGADYERRTVEHDEFLDVSATVTPWLRGEPGLATIEESVVAHELLFDLLETSGESFFPFT